MLSRGPIIVDLLGQGGEVIIHDKECLLTMDQTTDDSDLGSKGTSSRVRVKGENGL